MQRQYYEVKISTKSRNITLKTLAINAIEAIVIVCDFYTVEIANDQDFMEVSVTLL